MYIPMNELGLSSDERCEAHRIRVVDRSDPNFRSISTSRIFARDGVQAPCDVELKPSKSPRKCVALTDCDELLSTGLCFYDEGEAARFYPSFFAILNPVDVERWKCAATLFKENPPSGIWVEYEELLHTHTSDWPPLSQHGASLGVSIWVLFVCAALVYGGLHILPWNSDFGTTHEKVLWRASVGTVIGFGPAAMTAYLVKVGFNQRKRKRELQEPSTIRPCFVERFRAFKILKWLTVLVGWLVVVAVSLGYGVARIFIVVECFIALFRSEPGVFEVPPWSIYYPHIT